YYNDTAFLKQQAYPVLRGIAEFFSEMLHYNDSSKEYVLPPTLSLAEDYFVRNPIESMLAAKYVLAQAAKYSAILGVDGDLRKKWSGISAKVHIPQNKDYYLEWDGDDFKRAGGGYEGIRGYCYFGFPTTEYINTLDKAKMRRTLDAAWLRNGKGSGMVIFSINWAALSETYLKNPKRAMEMIDYGFHNWDPSGTAYLEVSPQKAYYHNSGITYVMLVATMALQMNDNIIKVFPAVPAQWKDFEFYDMPAYCGVRVSGKMGNGKVLWVSYSLNGKELLKLNEKKDVQIITGKNGVSLKVLK
ncbi:MAG: hypothetical protein H0X41_05560, partial [Chitinophagaceae bacterium]|nr:hypothetical protein [Chitinophagaceae bacterium]